MADQVYSKEELRKRVLAHLKNTGTHQTTLQVAQGIGVQFWAAELDLENAYRAKQVDFAEGLGWIELPVPDARGDRPAPAVPQRITTSSSFAALKLPREVRRAGSMAHENYLSMGALA